MSLRQFSVSAIALLSLALVVTDAHAQNQPPAGGAGRGQGRGQGAGRGGMMGGGMMAVPAAFNAVNPTPEQKQKFEDLQIRMRQDMQAMMQGGMDRQEAMAKFQEMNKKFQTDVEAILTPEQKTKFQAEMKMRSTPEGRFLAALDPVELTDEQKAKVMPIAKTYSDKMQTAMQDQNLQGRDRMEKMNTIFTEFKAQVRPLLTPEQQPKLDAINGMMGGGRGQGRPGGGQGRPQRNP